MRLLWTRPPNNMPNTGCSQCNRCINSRWKTWSDRCLLILHVRFTNAGCYDLITVTLACDGVNISCIIHVVHKHATLFSSITLPFSWSILIIFLPLETGMNTLQLFVIYSLNDVINVTHNSMSPQFTLFYYMKNYIHMLTQKISLIKILRM